MDDQFEADVRRWLSRPLEFVSGPASGEVGLARAILRDFWTLFPEYATSDPDAVGDQSDAIARAAGYASVERLIGDGLCLSDGGRAIRIEGVA